MTGYELEDRGSYPGKEGIIFFVIKSIPPLVATQFPVKWTQNGFWQKTKRPDLESNHSLLLEDRLRMCGAILSLPICLHGILLN
jgi:hypothetical protein